MVLKAKENEKKSKGKKKLHVRGFTEARAIAGAKDEDALSHKERLDTRRQKQKDIGTVEVEYYFDYNTVEKVLLMSAILLCLCAIMFKSGKFDNLYSEEDIFMQGLLITFAGGTIIFSLTYYITVLTSEATGYLPSFLKFMCGHNKAKKKRKRLSVVEFDKRSRNRSPSENLMQKNLELKTMHFQNNPLRGKLDKTKQEKERMEKEKKQFEAKNQALVERLRQAKKMENRKNVLLSKNIKRSRIEGSTNAGVSTNGNTEKSLSRRKLRKKQMAQKMMT